MHVLFPHLEIDCIPESFVHITFEDKGTLDAMMVDEKEGTVEMINSMFQEIERCIKNNGRYIIITLAQKHISKHLNNYFAKRDGWLIR